MLTHRQPHSTHREQDDFILKLVPHQADVTSTLETWGGGETGGVNISSIYGNSIHCEASVSILSSQVTMASKLHLNNTGIAVRPCRDWLLMRRVSVCAEGLFFRSDGSRDNFIELRNSST